MTLLNSWQTKWWIYIYRNVGRLRKKRKEQKILLLFHPVVYDKTFRYWGPNQYKSKGQLNYMNMSYSACKNNHFREETIHESNYEGKKWTLKCLHSELVLCWVTSSPLRMILSCPVVRIRVRKADATSSAWWKWFEHGLSSAFLIVCFQGRDCVVKLLPPPVEFMSV